MPPASRNHRTPTTGDTPASTAASSLERPAAIAAQNRRRSSRRATEGRPGDLNAPRPDRSGHRPRAFTATSFVEALRRPLESALYLPVFNEGALFMAGDGHAVQGDGEVCITAIETSLSGTFRLTVRKDLGWSWPFAENATHLISIGLDEDLDDAAKQAVREMVAHVCRRTNLSRN